MRTSHVLGELLWACPLACLILGPSLSSSPQTLFSLLPLQALRAPGTQVCLLSQQLRGEGRTEPPAGSPSSHWPCAEGQTVLLGLTATHSWGLPHSNCNAWERACSVLFGWSTWFCNKLKKKKKELGDSPVHVCSWKGCPRTSRYPASPFPGHPWG